MLQEIAQWSGVASIVLALIAIIILFLTRQNILDILDRDVILFDKNFELKKQAIERALVTADELADKGNALKNNFEFVENAKRTYNELLCVVSDVRVADEFYALALDPSVDINSTQLANFKLLCRHDIGLSNKKAKLVKRAKNGELPSTPTRVAPQEAPRQMPYSQPATRPAQAAPVNQSAPARPTQPRPMAQPVQQPRAGQRPMQQPGSALNAQRPTPQTRPNDEK